MNERKEKRTTLSGGSVKKQKASELSENKVFFIKYKEHSCNQFQNPLEHSYFTDLNSTLAMTPC